MKDTGPFVELWDLKMCPCFIPQIISFDCFFFEGGDSVISNIHTVFFKIFFQQLIAQFSHISPSILRLSSLERPGAEHAVPAAVSPFRTSHPPLLLNVVLYTSLRTQPVVELKNNIIPFRSSEFSARGMARALLLAYKLVQIILQYVHYIYLIRTHSFQSQV